MAIEDRSERNAEEALAPPGGFAHRLRRPADIKSVALTGLFVLAVFYTMYFMRAMLLPLVLALLLSYLFTPVVRALGYLRIRPLVGAGIVLLGLIGAIGYGVSFLSEPAAGWIEKAPYSLQQLQQKLLPLKKPIQKVAQASGEIEKLAAPEDPRAKPAVELKRHPITDLVVGRLEQRVEQLEQPVGRRAGEDQRIERVERARRRQPDHTALGRVGVDVVEVLEIRRVFGCAVGRVAVEPGGGAEAREANDQCDRQQDACHRSL